MGEKPQDPELERLARTVRELGERIDQLERRLDRETPGTPAARVAAPPRPAPVVRAQKSGLESRIGSQWLNRVGVVAFLFGVAYLLRFVSGWLSALAWVWSGVGAGLVVAAASEWFRARGYRVLSLSLKATGIGIAYLSLWAGLELYNVVSASTTFTGLVLLTLLNAALAMRESSQVLAALALTGGFLTPLLITVPSREAPLFLWLTALDCAAIGMAKKRDWRTLLPIALGGTIVVCAVWYFERYKPVEQLPAAVAATLFFGIFCAAARWVQQTSPVPTPISLNVFEVVNAAFYFVALDLLLAGPDDNAFAAVTLAVAALYFWMASREQARPARVPRTVAVYGGLGIALVAMALAVLLNRGWLSLGWFVEAAVVIAIGFWRDLPWVRWGALALLSAAVVKAFAFDVWQLSLGYRTLSFIALGALLLVISFAYQRYGFAMIAKNHKGPPRDGAERN